MTHYDCLGVSRSATREQIDRAYRRAVAALPEAGIKTWLARITGRGPEHLALARAVLLDEKRRREYDERLAYAEQIVWMAPGH
jgi:curved DNA-binding protein CbpA